MLVIQSIKFEVRNAHQVIKNIPSVISGDKKNNITFDFLNHDYSKFELTSKFPRKLIRKNRRSSIKITGAVSIDQPEIIKVNLRMDNWIVVHFLLLIAFSVFIYIKTTDHPLIPLIFFFLGLKVFQPIFWLIQDTNKCKTIIDRLIKREEEKISPKRNYI